MKTDMDRLCFSLKILPNMEKSVFLNNVNNGYVEEYFILWSKNKRNG